MIFSLFCFVSSVNNCRDYPWNIYTLKELQNATNNFHNDTKIGEGGFGSIYWGRTNRGDEAIIFIFFYIYTYLKQ